jgi:hypothetical protein
LPRFAPGDRLAFQQMGHLLPRYLCPRLQVFQPDLMDLAMARMIA